MANGLGARNALVGVNCDTPTDEVLGVGGDAVPELGVELIVCDCEERSDEWKVASFRTSEASPKKGQDKQSSLPSSCPYLLF